MQQCSDDGARSSRELVGTAEDLAAKLRAFESEGIVVEHLIEFVLPPKKQANAAEVTSTRESSASGPATEHASEPKKRLR